MKTIEVGEEGLSQPWCGQSGLGCAQGCVVSLENRRYRQAEQTQREAVGLGSSW